MEMSELEMLRAKGKQYNNRFLITGKPEVQQLISILTLANECDSVHTKDLAVKTCLQYFTKLIESND